MSQNGMQPNRVAMMWRYVGGAAIFLVIAQFVAAFLVTAAGKPQLVPFFGLGVIVSVFVAAICMRISHVAAQKPITVADIKRFIADHFWDRSI